MTTPNYVASIPGALVQIQVGDGATPTESFTTIGAINATRGIDFNVSSATDVLVDLNNQAAPGQTVRYIDSTDTVVSGSGLLNLPDMATMSTWVNSGASKNCKLIVGGTGGITISGPFKLTKFSITGERQKAVTISIELSQAAAVTQTTNI